MRYRTIARTHHMHPDRVKDPEQKARCQIAFQAFGELENRLVDEDQTFIAALRKKPEAKQRKPAASRQPPRKLPAT